MNTLEDKVVLIKGAGLRAVRWRASEAMETEEKTTSRNFSRLIVREPLRQELKTISSACINCELCQKECAFLTYHGKPKEFEALHRSMTPAACGERKGSMLR